jgi:uncharacterized membrane protein YphA (DoxX/SURF4 family)
MKNMNSTVRWVLTVLLTGIFLFVGSAKLTNPELWHDQFTNWGYPGWFSQVIGVVEVLGALALLYPALARFAAGLLALDMVGAVMTHLRAEEYEMLMQPLGIMAMLASLVYLIKEEESRRRIEGGGYQRPLPHH